MNLLSYKIAYGFSEPELALMLGLHVSTIHKYLHGLRCPTLEIALLMEEKTKGKVTPRELYQHWKKLQRDQPYGKQGA